MRIKDWGKFQHFKDRTPPWIKLYREILNDPDWHELDGESAKVLVMLWLLASEDELHNGALPSVRKLSFRLRMTESKLNQTLNKLSHWLIRDDIAPISERYQDGPSETEAYKAEAEAECATPSLSVDRIVEVWNMTPRLVPAKSVTGPILKRVKLRLAEHPEVEWWAALFTRVSASDFLTGRKTDFAATLDWVLGPKNLAKIEAGNYDNRDLPPPPRSYEGSYHKKVCL